MRPVKIVAGGAAKFADSFQRNARRSCHPVNQKHRTVYGVSPRRPGEGQKHYGYAPSTAANRLWVRMATKARRAATNAEITLAVES